jgi:hypothetical protein
VCRVRPRLVGSRSQHRAHALRAVRLTVWAKSLGVIGELISLIWAKSSGSAQLESVGCSQPAIPRLSGRELH